MATSKAGTPNTASVAVCLAGHSFVAVATTAWLLRIYSLAGRQIGLISLTGQPIALSAAGHSLGVVWSAGNPVYQHDSQSLQYAVGLADIPVLAY